MPFGMHTVSALGGERSGSKSGASFGNTKRESKVTIVQAGEQKCTEEIFIYK